MIDEHTRTIIGIGAIGIVGMASIMLINSTKSTELMTRYFVGWIILLILILIFTFYMR